MRIFINPGHALGGRPDPGAVNCEHGVTEAAINARVAENARIALERCGYETKVVQSHNLRGEAPGYPNVTGLANSWPADVFVSIHANAGGGRGCETYAFSTHSWGHALATTVQQTLWRAVSRIDKSFPNRGVKVNPDFTVLRRDGLPRHGGGLPAARQPRRRLRPRHRQRHRPVPARPHHAGGRPHFRRRRASTVDVTVCARYYIIGRKSSMTCQFKCQNFLINTPCF